MKFLVFTALLAFAIAEAPAKSITFGHGDWTIGCDNTGRCEAVGHQAENGADPIAMSLARDAGPGTPVRAQLIIPTQEGKPPTQVKLQLGRHSLAAVAVEQDLQPAQLTALLPWLLKEKAVLAIDGKRSWRLSLAGVNAVLLKMDAVQGRLDTPGALIRKGNKPESGVPKPRPAPQLVGLPVPATKPADHKLLPQIVKTLPDAECEPERESDVARLSASKLLVMRMCTLAAYQASWDLWIVNDKAPYAPVPVDLPMPDGQGGGELTAPFFKEGVLSNYAKSRGLGDCGEFAEWLWTAKGFQLLSWRQASMCRGIPGGQSVPLWTARRSDLPVK